MSICYIISTTKNLIAYNKQQKKGDRIAVGKVNDMMTNSMDPGYSEFRTGATAPKGFASLPDGVRLEFDRGFMLVCTFSRPTAKEKKAFKSGVAQFGLAVANDIIFFLSRFGTMSWMDMPFSGHLYNDNRMSLLEVPGPTQGYGLHVMLIDGATGILVHQRLIGLDHDLSMRLREAIINQPEIPNYGQRLQRTMAQYTTNDLVALANN